MNDNKNINETNDINKIFGVPSDPVENDKIQEEFVNVVESEPVEPNIEQATEESSNEPSKQEARVGNNEIPIEYKKISQNVTNPILEEQPSNQDSTNPDDNTAGSMIVKSIINAILYIIIIYLYLNVNKYIIFAIPVLITILSIFNAIKQKQKSDYPQAVLVGGILAAIITFIISMINIEKSDLYMYYTVASVLFGVIGIIISSSITKIISDFKNIKAMATIGYFLLFAGLIAAPIYAYKKYPEELFRYLFFEQIAVVAETEDEYILKTLRNRYGETFTCDNESIKHEHDQLNNQISTRRTCLSETGIQTTVQSIEYEASKVQYIVLENYLEERYFKQLKTDIAEKLTMTVYGAKVEISMYNAENCKFIGKCVECNEYYKDNERLEDRKKMYDTSVELNFQKKLTINALEFANQDKNKYIVTISGNYAGYQETDFQTLITKTLNGLNNSGLKNTYGYEIIIKNSQDIGGSNTYNKEIYKVTGTTNDEKLFKDPVLEQ